jgi:hypothetical protein
MSRSYSASTRNRLWRLVMSIARPDLQRNVGAEHSVGRRGGARKTLPICFHLRLGCCSSRHAPLNQA